jgi:cation diffusion facilitator family transporter
MQGAMRLSLAVGLLLLVAKCAAGWITGSSAILSDAAESILHVAAVGFAAFSLWLSLRPPTERFPYGYERVSFFSAGFEGGMIVLAAIGIILEAVRKWIAGLEFQHLGAGAWVVAAAGAINGALGWYLIRTGRRANSLIVVANGKHVLTDCWTSLGVVAGLLAVIATGWRPFDPLCAIAVACNILWSGGRLMRDSISGLMDYSDPRLGEAIHRRLDEICRQLGVQHHGLRYRHTGGRVLAELHLLFPFRTPLGEAHRLATELEDRLAAALDVPAEIITHLEALEDHTEVHRTRVSAH